MIELKLTVEQVNIVLNALAQRPYVEVAELIELIRTDGEKQLEISEAEINNNAGEI